MHYDNSLYGYRNENCIVQRNLGVPLYHRCTYCNKTSSECLGMQFNLSAGIIIVLLLLHPLVGKIGNIIVLAIAVSLLIRLGIIINRENDSLLINHYNLELKNRELLILLDAANAIASHFSLERTLGILSERIISITGYAYVRILVASDDGRKLVVKASNPAYGLGVDSAIGHIIEIMPEPPIVSLLTGNEPTILTGEQTQEIGKTESVRRGLFGYSESIQSILVAPIHAQGEYLGLIVMGKSECSDSHYCAPKSSVSVMSLAKHASMAAGIVIKNAQHYDTLNMAHLEVIMCLAETLETRDEYTRGHSDRTLEHATALSKALGLTHEQSERLQYAAILHDIGKIGIPDSILNKPGRLTDEEYSLMKSHPEKGANLAAKIRSLGHIAPLIRHHHEHWDGKGYPDGLSGEGIPIESRIVAVLDAYDAMTSDRVYRRAPGQEFAITELKRCSGTQFDPKVVKAFLEVLDVEATHESLRKTS